MAYFLVPVQALPRSLPPSQTLASQQNPSVKVCLCFWKQYLFGFFFFFCFLVPCPLSAVATFKSSLVFLCCQFNLVLFLQAFSEENVFCLVADLIGQNIVKVVWVFSEVVTKQLEQCLLWNYQHFVCTFQSDPGMAFSKLNILFLVADFKHCSLFPTECRVFITTENRSNILFWRKNKWDDVLYETNGKEVIIARSESQHWSQ